MTNNKYWQERARLDKIKVIKTGEQGINNLKRLLKLNLDDVEKKIKAFYDKYGENPAESLSYTEFQRYKAQLRAKAKKFPNDKTLQKLAKQDIPKYKIDRLRALQTDLQMQLTEATAGQEKGIYKTLGDVAKVSQATTATRFKGALGLEFNTIADRKMKQILSSDWSGTTWSERLWKDREKVGQKLTEILETGIPQGKSMQSMARELKNVTGQSFNNAFRLVRTEASHVDGQVTLEGYKQAQEDLGYTQYIYDAFLDDRTSKICRELNGKKFRIDDAEVGVNFPPMHPNCRSTTQLDESSIDYDKVDFFKDDEREAARNINKEDAKLFKEINNRSIKDVANVQQIEEIEQKIKVLGEFTGKVDLKGVPLEVAKDIYSATNKVLTRYPNLKGGVGITLAETIKDNGFADNLANITSIRLNKKLFTNQQLLLKTYQKNIEQNIHPANTTYKALIAHEFGHSMLYEIERKTGIKARTIENEVLKRAKYNKTDIANKLSMNASDSYNEFFAEAFAEYIESEKPRKLAKIFGVYLFELLSTI